MPGPATRWGLIILGTIVVGPILGLMILSLTSRRPGNLGPQSGKLRPCPGPPNCVCSCDAAATHAIAPLVWKGEPQAGLERVLRALRHLPRVTTEPIQNGNYLHAEFTTAVFRFVDDVEFLADPAAGVIHIRSASRAGKSDLGVNRKRVEEIRRYFDAER